MRQKILAANWKMHLSLEEAKNLALEIEKTAQNQPHKKILIFAPFVYLYPLHELLKNGRTELGGQNLYFERQGAFTGEVSAMMLKEVGCTWALVGHSERRQYFGETNDICNKKIKSALNEGLKVMYCVGETLNERERGLTEMVVLKQVAEGLKDILPSDFENLAIAYEPVWAIGTGKNATPEDAQKVHEAIRKKIKEIAQEEISQKFPILYGGSVNPDNAKELLSMKDIDGALVGGASLKIERFKPITQS